MVKFSKLLSIPFRNRRVIRNNVFITKSQWRMQSRVSQFPLLRKRMFSSAANNNNTNNSDDLSVSTETSGTTPVEYLQSRRANMQRYNYFYQGINATIASKIASLTNNKKSLNIIDIACGNADTSEYILDNKDTILTKDEISILGLDVSQDMLIRANDRFIEAGKSNLLGKGINGKSIRFKLEDAYNIGLLYENQFDLGIANFLYNYCSNIDDLFLMMRSSFDSIKEGGFVIGIVPMIHDNNMLINLEESNNVNILKKEFGWEHQYWEQLPEEGEDIEDVPYRWRTKSSYNSGFVASFYVYKTDIIDKIAKRAGFINGVEVVNKSEYVFNDKEFSSIEEKERSKKYWTSVTQPYELFIMKKE